MAHPTGLAPHHIVPRGAKADRFCIRSTDPTNVCDGARQILEDANISLEDPNNGVLLAWNHRRNKDPNTYAAFDAKHPNALAHDGSVHNPEVNGAVFDRLNDIRTSPDFPQNINDFTPAQREELQRDVQEALQSIQREILNGTFPQPN